MKEKLTTAQVTLFKKVVFGRFLDMHIIFNSPLVHYILLREVTDDRDDVMTFVLNGTIVTFSKELLLVTGLWQSPNPVLVRWVQGKAVGSLRNRYFRNDFVGDIHIGTLKQCIRIWSLKMTWML